MNPVVSSKIIRVSLACLFLQSGFSFGYVLSASLDDRSDREEIRSFATAASDHPSPEEANSAQEMGPPGPTNDTNDHLPQQQYPDETGTRPLELPPATFPPPPHLDVEQETDISANPAVQDVTGRSFFMSDLLAKGSPFHFGMVLGEMYDDNILISPHKVGDFITHIMPAIDFEKGDKTAPNANYINLYFAPTIFLYSDHSNDDRQDYDADVYYQHAWTRLTLGVEGHYQRLTDATIDIGNLAQRDIYTAIINGNYFYDDHLTIVGNATDRITSYKTGSDVHTHEWIADTYALYQVAPKLSLGAGPKLAITDIRNAPNESYEDLLAHLTYDPKGKISLTLSGGLEYLQYQSIGGHHFLPIFDFTLNYMPGEGTTVSLIGSSQSVNSYDLAGEVYRNTSVQIALKQRIIENLFLIISGGYTMADYEFSSSLFSGVGRKDDYYTLNAGVEWSPRTWLKVSGHYQHSEDSSTITERSFNDNQVDIQTSIWF